MSPPADKPELDSEKNTSSAKSSSTGKSGLLGFLLMLVLIVIGVVGFAGWKFWQEFESSILATSADTGSLKASQRQLENEIRLLRETLASKEQLDEILLNSSRSLVQLTDRISQTEQTLESLQQTTAGGNTSMIRAEARYLVQIASDELLLRANTVNALRALRAADDRLRGAGGSLFGNARASISQKILALESLPDADITGMALTLASLANAVGSLPLRKPGEMQGSNNDALPEDASAWDRFKAATKRLFGSVVTVRHDTDPRPFITPGQEYFLLRNLELKLESTRLSLLMHDTDNFRASTEVSLQWLERYFDNSDPAVDAAREQLQLMRETNLPTGFPDLSDTLHLLEAGE